ncbi:MAG: DUF4148 domain-containing protein [Burkholderiales bacterium]|nr:DUF4148 domain-containing protein [Burkholderiales bacterium]
MNTFKSFVYPTVVLLSLAAAVTAHAESPMPEDQSTVVFAQPKSRDQVQAELFQARADGWTKVLSFSYDHMAAAKSLRSRDDVRVEAIVANRAGVESAWYGEDSGSFALARVQPSRHVAERIVASR